MTGTIDQRYVSQMEHLAEENGRMWTQERECRERRDTAILGIQALVDGANALDFYQLRAVLDKIGRICEVELKR